MELFTMTPNFMPDEMVDGFVSAIWTERFFTNGDCQIVVPATLSFQNLLKEGKFLGLRGSKEVMILENQTVDNGLLTVTGNTLEEFLNTRQAWFENSDTTEGQPSTAEYKANARVAAFIADVVTRTVIDPDSFSSYTDANLDWDREKIPNLTLGEVAGDGLVRPRTMAVGALYDGLRSLATSDGLGFRIYLDEADDSDYSLKFAIWHGRDRTSEQELNPLVRLSPTLNSLLDTKEVVSISEYKNVVYVHFKNHIYTFYAEPTLPIPEGFQRRSMVRMAEGDVAEADEAAYIAQHAADAFANNNYIRAIDGQTSIPSQYMYQRDYRLGDIIELEGITGLLTKARVTEYIRSQDQLGDRAYPTIAVVDPLDSGNLPTIDTNVEDFTPDEPPDYTDDPYTNDPMDPDFPDPNVKPYKPPKPSKNPLPAANQPFPDPDPDPIDDGGGDPGGGGGDGGDGDDHGTTGTPWTPGPNPAVAPPPGVTFYSMRAFPWVAEPGASEGYEVGTMTVPPGTYYIRREYVLDGFSYAEEGDRVGFRVLTSSDTYMLDLFCYAEESLQPHGEWPFNGYAIPGHVYGIPGDEGELGIFGGGTITITSNAEGLDWAGDVHDPELLPTLTGHVAIWLYQ